MGIHHQKRQALAINDLAEGIKIGRVRLTMMITNPISGQMALPAGLGQLDALILTRNHDNQRHGHSRICRAKFPAM